MSKRTADFLAFLTMLQDDLEEDMPHVPKEGCMIGALVSYLARAVEAGKLPTPDELEL